MQRKKNILCLSAYDQLTSHNENAFTEIQSEILRRCQRVFRMEYNSYMEVTSVLKFSKETTMIVST